MIGNSVLRGEVIRTRDDVQYIAQEPQLSLGARARKTGLSALGRLLGFTVWGLVMAGWFLTYVPVLGVLAAAAVLAGATASPGWELVWFALVVVVVAGAGLGLWGWRWPDAFEVWVSSRVFRFGRRIRYRWQWSDLMAAAGLHARDARHRVLVPRLLWVRLGRYADVLTVQLCPGVTREHLAEKVEALRSEFHALDVRLLPAAKRGWICLRVIHADTLADVITAPRSAAEVDLSAVQIGRCDDGTPWLLRLLEHHLLVAGATGAGKGSVVWSVLAQLAPAIRDGWVRVIGIDPKGGMELGMGRGLFHMLAHRSEEDLVVALEVAAALVQERAEKLAGHARRHTPTTAEPFVLVVIDEIASLTAYITDRQLKERAKAALGRLLTKGRAPGVSVIGCVQDPRKDVLDLRNLFTTRIGLRLGERTEVDMVLGDGARARGARCDEISDLTPGVGYVVQDSTRTVARVRAAFVDDEQIRYLAATYPSPTSEDPYVTQLPVQRRSARKTARTGDTGEVS
ncbi:FtsK/SpoIIIE domain-containing protein [Pseudonocardia bannensis]|uniref:Cell division protein FtsK n=1 Tax=Pseudonocardia bannensis TaxID=630973 RepID=A0A848DKG7_9PSEU|nr:FtsK/SpoIIIE domain-containing protein [Pseudonocardia bannensis]NMH93182.1 cell division protein FtsK [Pseudonocardia bannensis]